MTKDKLDNNFILLEVVHTDHSEGFKTGITIDLNSYKVLKELYNQFGEFTIDKVNDSSEIQLITK